MKTIKHSGLECVALSNSTVELLVTQSVGPRIISLKYNNGENIFADLPDLTFESIPGETYHFYGGHRLWYAPEVIPLTYMPDNQPVEITPTQNGLLAVQPIETQTGIEKSIQISMVDDFPQIILQHMITNRGLGTVTCAPWAITQLKKGGVAILPQSQSPTGFRPNRSLAIWPYTDFNCPQVNWGNRYILVHPEIKEPFKIGFPNPQGWLAYWLGGILFVKRAAYQAQEEYYDLGSSSECYCNSYFLELETLAPISVLEPGDSVTHIETWELYPDIDYPDNEEVVESMVEKLKLE